MKQRLISTVAVAGAISATLLNEAAAADLFADGGKVSDVETPCLSSWTYKALDGTRSTLSGCVSIEDYPPYPLSGFSGSSDSAELDLLEPQDLRTSKLLWCSTASRYSVIGETQNSWGYCLDNDATMPAKGVVEPGFYADGPYQTSPMACLTSWKYKVKVGGVSTVSDELSGCVSMDEFKPYPFYSADQDAINALPSPQFGATDKNKWCAVIDDQYNPAPERSDEKKLYWGWCLDLTSQSDAPTKQPTTKSPTAHPTATPLEPGIYADGGFSDSILPCVDEFVYKDADKNKFNLTGCVSFNDFKPWPYADPSSIPGSGVKEPKNELTDGNKWCATRDVYNPFPGNSNMENRLEWGYCLEIVATTDKPTSSPVGAGDPTKSPTTKAPTTKSPTTKAPAAAPKTPTGSDEQNTPAPTFEQSKPAPSPTEPGEPNESGKDGGDGGKIAGIVIAVILIAVAGVLGGLYALSVYRERQSEEENSDNSGTERNETQGGETPAGQQRDVEKQTGLF